MAVDAVQDANQNFSPVFARGTLGTADVKGTSGVVSGAADPATGAQYVYNLGPAGSTTIGDIPGGTIDLITTVSNLTNGSIRVTAGTITSGSIVVTAGTVETTMGDLSGGTIDLLTTGSISNLAMLHAGTLTQLGTIQNVGVIHNAGTLAGGTISGAGVVTTISNLTNGTVRVTAGTINTGTINLGTVVGKDANAAATTAFPVLTGGMDGGGTAYAFKVDVNGHPQVDVQSGTFNLGTVVPNGGTVGTVPGVGVVTTVTNLANGTIQNSGTTTGVGTVSNIGSITNIGMLHGGTVVTTMGDLTGGTIDEITNGSIRVTAGTVSQAGAWNVTGTVANGSIAVTAGTITNLLKAEDAGHSTGDSGILPLAVRVDGGTSLVGTDLDYAPIQVDANGALRISGTVATGAGTQPVSIIDGTVTNVGTVANVGVVHNAGTIAGGTIGVVTTVNNLTNGTVRVTAGTINTGTINLGTVVGNIDAGQATASFPVYVGGNNNGTVRAFALNASGEGSVIVGTVPGIGVVSNLTNGSVRVTAGTVAQSGAWNVTGTINSGTIDSVTAVANLTNGTVRVAAGTVNSGTINAGTVTVQPYPASQVQPAFAIGTAAIGTLVSAAGAGTGIYPNSVILTAMSGTLDMCLSFGLGSTTNQVVQRGLYSPGQGVAISFDNPSFYGTANSALTYQILSGAGTASWAVTYNTKGTP